MTKLVELIEESTWFPAALDPHSGTLSFAKTDRDTLSKEAFLDKRMAGSGIANEVVDLSDAIAACEQWAEPAPAFIFHSSFCCSTLMARALDAPGAVLALKEPDVLMGLANALRVDDQARASTEYAMTLTRLILALLGRTFVDRERILIKPTNSANNLLPLVAETDAKIILLYGSLRSFLVSVLKKGEACKSFVRQQYNIFALDSDGLAKIPQRQAVGLTDLQAAAVVWRHQMELFQRTLQQAPHTQIRSLNFEDLITNPEQTLRAASAHLELPHAEGTFFGVAENQVFSRNSKFTDQTYGADQRHHDVNVIEERYGDTLDVIEQWAGQLDLGTSLQMPMAQALDPG